MAGLSQTSSFRFGELLGVVVVNMSHEKSDVLCVERVNALEIILLKFTFSRLV